MGFLSYGQACVPLQFIVQEELDKRPKHLEMHWQRKGGEFAFQTREKKAGFFIEVEESVWKNLPKKIQAKFHPSENGYRFSYAFAKGDQNLEREYCIAARRLFQEAHPLEIDLPQLAEWIKTKNVVFYTGAGISAAAGVPTMHHLDYFFPFTPEWIEEAVSYPREVIRKVNYFRRTCYESLPTTGHWALKAIAERKQIPLLTENFDHLHQKTGIIPFCVLAASVKKEISPEDLKKIDAIICIGLSYDDKGLLGWYKQLCPQGTIISIDLRQPSYLGEEDFLLKGDIQEVLPALEDYLRVHNDL